MVGPDRLLNGDGDLGDSCHCVNWRRQSHCSGVHRLGSPLACPVDGETAIRLVDEELRVLRRQPVTRTGDCYREARLWGLVAAAGVSGADLAHDALGEDGTALSALQAFSGANAHCRRRREHGDWQNAAQRHLLAASSDSFTTASRPGNRSTNSEPSHHSCRPPTEQAA